MTKKIRLIDEPEAEETTGSGSGSSNIDNAQLMKYLEAIDWKLWELLKVAKKAAGEN